MAKMTVIRPANPLGLKPFVTPRKKPPIKTGYQPIATMVIPGKGVGIIRGTGTVGPGAQTGAGIGVTKKTGGAAKKPAVKKPPVRSAPRVAVAPVRSSAPKYSSGGGGGSTRGASGGSTTTKPPVKKPPTKKPPADKPAAPVKSLEQQAQEAVSKMYAPAFAELTNRGNDITANDASMNATAAAFQQWRDSRTDAANQAIAKANTDAGAQVQANLAAMGQSMADTQSRIQGLTGSAGGNVDAAVSAALAQIAQTNAGYASNAQAAAATQANKQRQIDVANQQALLTDFAGITSKARKDLSTDKTNLELQKSKAIQDWISEQRQAEMDQQLQNYAMGRDAANLQLKYDTLASNEKTAAANAASRERIAKAQIEAANYRADQSNAVAQTNARTSAARVQLQQQGANDKKTESAFKAALAARDRVMKGWEKSKPTGETYTKSVKLAVQGTLKAINAQYVSLSAKQKMMILDAVWGTESVKSVYPSWTGVVA